MNNGGDEIFMEYTNHYRDIQGMETDNSEFCKDIN